MTRIKLFCVMLGLLVVSLVSPALWGKCVIHILQRLDKEGVLQTALKYKG